VVRIESTIFCGRAPSRPTPFTLLLEHLEAFSLPNQSETISTDRKTFGPENGMDLPIAEARIALRQLVNSANQLRFLDTA
jgi:hypothetical protein